MNKIQNKVSNMVGECLKNNPSEPCIAECLIRWKDGQIVEDKVLIGKNKYDEERDCFEYPEADEATMFTFPDMGSMVMCTTALDFDIDDFENDMEYENAVALYAQAEDDRLHYFGSLEDFDILDIYAVYPASEY